MRFLFGCLFLLVSFSGFSQDLIIKHHSLRIEAKVLEISETEIRFKNPEYLDGPTYILNRKEVYKIKHPNGKETVFPSAPGGPAPTTKPAAAMPAPASAPAKPKFQSGLEKYPTPNERYQAGRLEALDYQGGGAFWGTAGATFLYTPAGLLLGIIVAAAPPSVDKNVYLNRDLLNDPDFRAGYKKQAHKRKVGKAAAGFGIGLGASLLLFVATQ